jgi:hypothetical protein
LLPFDTLKVPPTLKSPSCGYEYVRRAAEAVRAEMHVGVAEPLDFPHLIKRFGELQTILIPVMWGEKQHHANAVHIFLPKSGTTWVYLNLDVNVHDFKFWMAHELGHTLTPDLRGENAEDFADAFAAALLFPHELVEKVYTEVRGEPQKNQLKIIKWWAKKLLVSPFTIYCQLSEYAGYTGNEVPKPSDLIHKVTTVFNAEYPTVSKQLFRGEAADPSLYIKTVREYFETPVFEVLGNYLRTSDRGPGFVQTVLDISLLDAKAIHAELK